MDPPSGTLDRMPFEQRSDDPLLLTIHRAAMPRETIIWRFRLLEQHLGCEPLPGRLRASFENYLRVAGIEPRVIEALTGTGPGRWTEEHRHDPPISFDQKRAALLRSHPLAKLDRRLWHKVDRTASSLITSKLH